MANDLRYQTQFRAKVLRQNMLSPLHYLPPPFLPRSPASVISSSSTCTVHLSRISFDMPCALPFDRLIICICSCLSCHRCLCCCCCLCCSCCCCCCYRKSHSRHANEHRLSVVVVVVVKSFTHLHSFKAARHVAGIYVIPPTSLPFPRNLSNWAISDWPPPTSPPPSWRSLFGSSGCQIPKQFQTYKVSKF